MVAQKAPRRFQHPASFSYLGVPAATGMSDCYESMPRTPIRGWNPATRLVRAIESMPRRYGAAIQPQRAIPASRNPEGRRNLVAPALAPRPTTTVTAGAFRESPRGRRTPLLPAPAYAIPPAIWMIVTYAPCGSFKHTNRPTPSTSRTGVISVAPSSLAFARDLSRSAIAK